jgi:hypothetical protein
MITMRHEVDPQLRWAKPPDLWLLRELWQTPENVILGLVEERLGLLGEGFPEELALTRLAAFFGLPLPRPSSFHSLLGRRLARTYPSYLQLGPSLLEEVLAVAEAGARELRPVRGGAPYPPLEWLRTTVDLTAVEDGEELFRVRMLEGDEIWEFSSPPSHWRQMRGRSGFVLLREGRRVFHLITKMN